MLCVTHSSGLQAALHIHCPTVSQHHDDFLQMPHKHDHPLDSSLTCDVLRYRRVDSTTLTSARPPFTPLHAPSRRPHPITANACMPQLCIPLPYPIPLASLHLPRLSPTRPTSSLHFPNCSLAAQIPRGCSLS